MFLIRSSITSLLSVVWRYNKVQLPKFGVSGDRRDQESSPSLMSKFGTNQPGWWRLDEKKERKWTNPHQASVVIEQILHLLLLEVSSNFERGVEV